MDADEFGSLIPTYMPLLLLGRLLYPDDVMPPLEVSSQVGSNGVLIIGFAGSYPSGSAGNSIADWMVETGKKRAQELSARAVVIDLRRLKYKWGDVMEWVYGIGRS